jgi:tetratricopeptide (TPR) repeat protein
MRKLALFLGLVLLLQPCWAKETVYGMSKKTYDAINEVQPLIDDGQWQEALELLQKLREKKINGYETAHVLNMVGYIWFNLEENEKALASYEEALAQEDLPDSQIRGLLNAVSQVSLAIGNYVAAEKYARQLLEAEIEAPQPLSQVVLAQALVGQERYAEAVAPMQTALDMQRATGANPRENWMVMLSSIYYSLERYEDMRDLLYEIVALYPSERYILNLAAVHGQLEEPEKQLALVESLRDDERLQRGFHLLTLANLYLSQGNPFKAAQLLEQEIDAGSIEGTQQNLELTSQAWYMAGEEARAIPPLQAAAEQSEDGELYLRIARLYMDLYEYGNAEKAARLALDKGDLREPGDAWLLVGMALARGEKLEAARVAFIEAAEYESSEKWARQWMRFVKVEQDRIAAFTLTP